MPAWLFGLAITLLVGSASTAYLWLIRRRDDETSAGLLAIAGLRWREFTRILIEAMRGRGMEPVKIDSEDPQEPSSNFLLRNAEGRPWLLACKHGSAYRIGSVAMDELAAEIRLNGAVGGTLATEGTLEAEGRDKAAHHNIEILDGPRLWPVAKPFMDTGLVQRIVGQAKATALRHIGIAWLAAFTLGLAVMLALPEVATPPPDPAPLPPPAASTMPAASAAAPATAVTADNPAALPDEAELERQRVALARALAARGGIRNAMWNSRSTLSVDRIASEDEALKAVCEELARHPDIGLIRVQLNPPPGSGEAIRWRQCPTAQ